MQLRLIQYAFLYFGLGLPISCEGQLQWDKHWILTDYIQLSFNQNIISSNILEHPGNGLVTGLYHNNISDEAGNILFHSSGCLVMDSNCNIMFNGDSLDISALQFGYCHDGYAVWDQNTIILPFPEHENQYILFTLDVEAPFPPEDTMYTGLVPLHMFYHVIDMNLQNGLGEVIQKRQIAVSDTLARGYIQACRHANGRDWWVSVPEWNSNCYYFVLVSPEEIPAPVKYCSGPDHGDLDFGAAVGFSPDGIWYARSFSWIDDTLSQVDLFSFDRCTGELQHQYNLKFPNARPDYTGLSFSPNSQFLYVSSYKSLWQYDLWSDDIQESLVEAGKIEGNLTTGKGGLFAQRTGPNNKTYINSPLGHYYLSTVHYPDRKGVECQFKQHDLLLPEGRQNYRGLPNYPNYRLGPIDGSSCDTLMLNNSPISNFRYEIKSIHDREVEFISLSYHEPENFHWDFGDGNSSNEQNPVHVYDSNGIYTVCLTTDNFFGSDSFCQDVDIFTTSTYLPHELEWLSIYPIPVEDILHIQSPELNSLPIHIQILSITGELIVQKEIFEIEDVIDLLHFPSGLYMLKAINSSHHFKYLPFVKI